MCDVCVGIACSCVMYECVCVCVLSRCVCEVFVRGKRRRKCRGMCDMCMCVMYVCDMWYVCACIRKYEYIHTGIAPLHMGSGLPQRHTYLHTHIHKYTRIPSRGKKYSAKTNTHTNTHTHARTHARIAPLHMGSDLPQRHTYFHTHIYKYTRIPSHGKKPSAKTTHIQTHTHTHTRRHRPPSYGK